MEKEHPFEKNPFEGNPFGLSQAERNALEIKIFSPWDFQPVETGDLLIFGPKPIAIEEDDISKHVCNEPANTSRKSKGATCFPKQAETKKANENQYISFEDYEITAKSLFPPLPSPMPKEKDHPSLPGTIMLTAKQQKKRNLSQDLPAIHAAAKITKKKQKRRKPLPAVFRGIIDMIGPVSESPSTSKEEHFPSLGAGPILTKGKQKEGEPSPAVSRKHKDGIEPVQHEGSMAWAIAGMGYH